ncbi:acetolactate decarboxylase [Lignipirellula cremea]|uniref:Alpha-acetolactate decarboxylase n=1 Tax=Lignipirellula cremea TaxID=2528010 RepID=A0A518DVM2_9BACT|nr:acetolactate decarboxylase [Lignipirellula cremea]QDU95887.1 Alpha-acetolactate decarboxylase precursor [Lignipirellula cremea]
MRTRRSCRGGGLGLAVIGLAVLATASCTRLVVEEPPGVSPAGQPAAVRTAGDRQDQITQFSVINALMLGQYDGSFTFQEVLEYGDFGLGTLDHLDGEMIILDGQVFQVRGDGKVVEVDPQQTTPFAIVARLEPEGEFACDALAGLADLERLVDQTLAQKNHFIAIRVEGQFPTITVRSVHPQQPPYKPLAEVASSQSVWTHTAQRGTLVGIRCPTWVHGLNVPGYHWHFLSADRTVGGHVLACQLREARLQYDICRDWLIKLPDNPRFNTSDLGADLRTELDAVERARTDKSAQ